MRKVSSTMRRKWSAMITAKTLSMPRRTVFFIKSQASVWEIESVLPFLVMVLGDFDS